jgi:hypothetical protein
MPSDEHSGSNPFEPNPALRMLNRWFFDKIQVDEDWVLQVR